MKWSPLIEGKTESQQNAMTQIGPISAKLCFAFFSLIFHSFRKWYLRIDRVREGQFINNILLENQYVFCVFAHSQYFERKRKAKKQAKRDLKAGKIIPKRRDPGIPNSWPFKEEMLQEVFILK